MFRGQGAESKYISFDDVRIRINEVCDILDIARPETIIYKEFGWSIRQPRLKDDGRTILIYKCETEADINFQLWLVFEPIVTRRAPRWIVRHMYSVLYPLFFLVLLDWIFVVGLLSDNIVIGLMYSFLLQIPYVGIALPFIKIAKERVKIWTNAMMDAGIWSEKDASDYKKGYPHYPLALFLGGAMIALILGVFIILSQP